jgi:hypothetical protein
MHFSSRASMRTGLVEEKMARQVEENAIRA